MKRILSYITIISASVLFFSCVEEMEQVYEDPKEEKIFYASVDNKDSLMTKTVISQNPDDGKYQLHWLQEDCIGISSGNNTVEKFVNISTENGKSAIFKGSIATSSVYYAVYPYKEGMTMPSKKFTVDIPAVQPYAEKTFAPEVCPMAGKSDSDSKIYFNNLCGVLVINLTGSEKIRSISFSGKDVSGVPLQISGEFTVDMNYSDAPTLVSTENSTSLVTVKCENPVALNESTPTQFHFVLPPAEYASFRLIISTEDGTVMIKEGVKPLTIKRANITKAGALEYVETIDIDLSENGNSNCYIVNGSGLYSFDATVIGNGEFGLVKNANFHTDDVNITPASAELLWSSPETAVSDANYDPESGKISFYASGIEGNALIAAKDAEGNILWSWHIWATDQPQDQHYVNSIGEFDVQDRNLGATRADRGTGDEWKESTGIEYYWGRKDPFIGALFTSTSSTYSIVESIANPTVTSSWTKALSLWRTDQKTIYDPCPIGYRVAPLDIWDGFSISNTTGAFDNGWYFLYDGINSSWYPTKSRGSESGVSYWGDSYMWSSTRTWNDVFYFSSSSTQFTTSRNGEMHQLRCMKDNETSTFVLEWLELFMETQTKAKLSARLNVSGNVTVERGFVLGDVVHVTLENGTNIQCENGEGNFEASTPELTPSTKYYVRPYAIIGGEVHYGPSRQIMTPDEDGSVDLSADGTSNSYVISVSGTYTFNCTVKGNGTESVGNPYTAEVLWETMNTSDAVTQSSVISSVSLEDGCVRFSTPETFTSGNALIVVKNITGKIIWSWHIWAVDFDPEGFAQIYPSGAMMMDRNLGALNNVSGDVRSFGLYYQWGRKDPFVGAGDTSSSTFAATSPADVITYVDRDSSTDLLDYAVRYPQRVIKNSSWNNVDGYWNDNKTQYDPCPPGWRVPDRDVWSEFNASEAYYPAAGNVYNGGLNSGTYYWTNHRCYYWSGSSAGYTRDVHYEFPVRCMKDAVFAVSNKTEADVIRDVYVTVSGTLTVSDDTKMEAKGFICSTTSDPKIYTEGCIMTDEGTASGDFTSTIKGLNPGTTYYIRAYAKGGYNVRYGNVITVKTKEGADGEGYIEDDEIFEW